MTGTRREAPPEEAQLIKRVQKICASLPEVTVAPYIGQHGWVTVWGDDAIDWSEIPELIVDAYRASAPKRLLRELDDAAAART